MSRKNWEALLTTIKIGSYIRIWQDRFTLAEKIGRESENQ